MIVKITMDSSNDNPKKETSRTFTTSPSQTSAFPVEDTTKSVETGEEDAMKSKELPRRPSKEYLGQPATNEQQEQPQQEQGIVTSTVHVNANVNDNIPRRPSF